jgi:hypothetical protein
MTEATRSRPLVVVLYEVPLFVEALDGLFEGLADVRPVPRDGSAEPLVHWLRPDALIVDGPVGFAPDYADAAEVPVVHVDLHESRLGVRSEGRWVDAGADTSPEAIRSALVASLVGEGVR